MNIRFLAELIEQIFHTLYKNKMANSPMDPQQIRINLLNTLYTQRMKLMKEYSFALDNSITAGGIGVGLTLMSLCAVKTRGVYPLIAGSWYSFYTSWRANRDHNILSKEEDHILAICVKVHGTTSIDELQNLEKEYSKHESFALSYRSNYFPFGTLGDILS